MWPFRKNKESVKESQQAILDSAKSLREVTSRNSEVHAVARTLKDIREKNHFADRLRTIMEGG